MKVYINTNKSYFMHFFVFRIPRLPVKKILITAMFFFIFLALNDYFFKIQMASEEKDLSVANK